jgi:hypothetical protein
VSGESESALAPRRLGRFLKKASGSFIGLILIGGLVMGLLEALLGIPLWVGVVAVTMVATFRGESPRDLWRTSIGRMQAIRQGPRDERYWNTLAPAILPPLVGWSMWSLWPSAGRGVDAAFYSTLAQIIPVLFLAGVVEVAALRTSARIADDFVILRLLVIGLGVGAFEGEVAALYAVATETTSSAVLGVAVAAVFLQFAMLLFVALGRLR